MADKGTLFLDEVGTFPETIQIKLLRFLQDKIIEPVGGTKRIPVDVRIISATNENLRDLIGDHAFREDLFYRLNIMEIFVPPLRERKEDVPLLINQFVNVLNSRYQKTVKGVSSSTLKKLMQYPWPGNVRQLENAIEHAYVLAGGNILTLKHFPSDIRLWVKDEIDTTGQEDEGGQSDKQKIEEALTTTAGNINDAAEALGMHRTTFWRKMKELGLNKQQFKNS